MSQTSDPRRALLVAVATILVLAGGLLAYAGWAVVDEDQFTERAGAALREPDVVDEIGLRLADRMARDQPELERTAPALHQAAAEAAARHVLAGPLIEAVRRMHHTLFTARAPAELRPHGSRAAVRAALGSHDPRLAAAMPAGPDVALLTVGRGSRLERDLRSAAPVAPAVVPAAPFVIVLGLLLLAVAVIRAADRWRAFRTIALTLALVTTAVAVGTWIALEVLLQTFTSAHGDAVVSAIWNAFLDDLRDGSLLVALAATVAAIAGTAAARRGVQYATDTR